MGRNSAPISRVIAELGHLEVVDTVERVDGADHHLKVLLSGSLRSSDLNPIRKEMGWAVCGAVTGQDKLFMSNR